MFQNSLNNLIISEKMLSFRCSFLDEAASYAPLLDQLSNCLKNACAAPPPKINTVKPISKMTSNKLMNHADASMINANHDNNNMTHIQHQSSEISVQTMAGKVVNGQLAKFTNSA